MNLFGDEHKGSKELMEKLSKILQTNEGKALLSSIAVGGGDALKETAKKAYQSSGDVVRVLVGALMSSSDGIMLLSRLMSVINMISKGDEF